MENTILHGSCIEVLKTLPEKCVDLVYADPPYNLQLSDKDLARPDGSLVNAVRADWDKFESNRVYDTFTRDWISECLRVMKPKATFFVQGRYQNIYRVGTIMQDLGMFMLNDITWIMANPMPNMSGTRLCQATENIIWAQKKKGPKTFNYQFLKSENGDRQLRTDWYFPICSGGERLRDDEGKKLHDTQKPLKLIERIVLMASSEGDVVMDPFFGTGTTGVAAKMHGRGYIGIEMDKEYIKIAQDRIDGVVSL